jgi:hypothetical protein
MRFEYDEPDDLYWLEKMFHYAIMSTETYLLNDPQCKMPIFAEYRLQLIKLRRKIYSWQQAQDPNEHVWEWMEPRDKKHVEEIGCGIKLQVDKFLEIENNEQI